MPTLKLLPELAYLPSKAVDIILTTFYVSADQTQAASDWIQLGFSRPRKIVSVSITRPTSSQYDSTHYDFKVFKARHIYIIRTAALIKYFEGITWLL